MREQSITEEEATAQHAEATGDSLHPYLVGFGGKSWGGEGAGNFDAHKLEIQTRMRERSITAEQATAQLAEGTGASLHPHLLALGRKSAGGAAGGGSAAATAKLPHATAVLMAAADEFYSVLVTHAEKNTIISIWTIGIPIDKNLLSTINKNAN